MYALEKAVLRERGINKIWASVDISNMTLPQIFKQYHSGYIVLSATTLDHLQYVDLNTLKQGKYTITTQTFTVWLQTLGNTKLPATQIEPKFTENRVGYIDAWQGGYAIQRVYPPTGLPSDTRPDSELTDALLYKPGLANSYLKDALVTVNGYLHRCAVTRNGLQIQGAGKTLDLCQDNRVGLLSFKKVGGYKIVGLTDDMIHRAEESLPLYRSAYAKLNIDLDGKSVLMSIGGYLTSVGFDVINPSDGLISINIPDLNVHKRITESLDKIDLSSLGLYIPDNLVHSVSVAQCIDDTTLRKYLTLSQTFFIVIDTPSLSVDYIPVENPNLFGLYELSYEPTYPLIDSLGRLPEYNKMKQGLIWTIRSGELYYRDYNFESSTLKHMDRSPRPVLPDGYHKEIGHLLEIRSMELL